MLAQWILEYRQDAGSSPYPFGRPYRDLYLRCRKACDAIGSIASGPCGDVKAKKQLSRIQKAVSPFLHCEEAAAAFHDLNGRIALFDGLRAVFGFESATPAANANASKGAPNAAGSRRNCAADSFEAREAKMKDKAGGWLTALKQKLMLLPSGCDMSKAVKTVVDHLERHWPYLWGHRATVQTGGAYISRAIGRTNNLLETFFHTVKHRERRRSGRKNLGRDFDGMPASALLAANLLIDSYVEIVCGSLGNLPLLFAQIDQESRADAYNMVSVNDASVTGCLHCNKAFVRGPAFNSWVESASNSTGSLSIQNDIIRTGGCESPFDIIGSFLGKSIAL